MPKEFVNPLTLFPSIEHGFSQVVVVSGVKTVFISGRTARDANKRVVGRNCGEQAHQAFQNVRRAVEAGGGALQAVFTTNPPASTWIGVSALALPDFLIEVEATAVLD